MREIMRILKKYIFGILLVILLLFVQANCDLALPEYTSDIINVGIQQKGIEDAVPNVLSKSSMEVLSVLDEENIIESSYKLINKGDKSYKEKYPLVEKEDIYVLKDLKEEEREELEETMLAKEVFLMSSSTLKKNGFVLDATSISYFMKTNEDNEIKTMYKKTQEMDKDLLKQYGVAYCLIEYENIGIDIEAMQMNYLFKTGTKMILFAFFIMVVIVATTYLSGRIASQFAYDLRSLVVQKVMSFSNGEYNEFSTSSLITRVTNDVSQIQNLFTMLLRIVLYAPIIGIGALVKVAGIDMVWVVGIAIAAVLILILILLVFALPKFRVVQKLIDRINLVVREALNGLPVIRAFANEEFEKNKFNKANDDLKRVNLFTQRLMSAMNPIMMLIMNGTCVLIFWIGAEHIDTGAMQVGTLTALITYTMQIIMSFLMLSMISIMAPRALIAINRVGDVLKKETSIQNKEVTVGLDNSGTIEFKHVSFQYPDGDALVLKDLNFKVEKGTTTAIIGSTGSGKSSIVNLIPRFFDITEGSIVVNGVDVRDADLEELRSKIGVVPQKGLLFSGTIASNIKFSNPDMSDEDMMNAANIACAKEFIEKKELKYDDPISQGGTNVSGGQRQRLAIARAVAKKPEIYIFDDSFSALDYKTDATIRKNLAEYCGESTKIIVAQRVATVMHADQIIVLDKGEIVGIGRHEDLFKNCKIYKEIALSQLKEEELV